MLTRRIGHRHATPVVENAHMTRSSVDEGQRMPAQLNQWADARNYVAVGNLGEQIMARLLSSLGYQLLGAQDDLVGMVSEVLGEATRDNPEDMIAIDPQGRLVTVNSKAAISRRSCRIKRDGNLTNPRMGRGQNRVEYSTRRANLISFLEGDSFAQVVKVDLRNSLAQIFEIADDGKLDSVSEVVDVNELVVEILAAHPDHMPPPNAWDFAE